MRESSKAQRRMGSAMGEASYTSDELYMLHNHTGSIIGTYDLNGAQQEGEDYYPFGETAHNWNGNKLHRFGGKLRSFSSGFYMFGARQYAPWLAKFTSVDPLAAKSTDRNPYHYASNNPINRVDPSGMKDEDANSVHDKGQQVSRINNTETQSERYPVKQQLNSGKIQLGTDYFDMSGKFLFTDTNSKSNNIMILPESNDLNKSIPLTSVDWKKNGSGLFNIASYYNSMIGGDEKIKFSKNLDISSIMSTSHSRGGVSISLNYSGKVNSDELLDKFNFMSVLIHENYHWSYQKG